MKVGKICKIIHNCMLNNDVDSAVSFLQSQILEIKKEYVKVEKEIEQKLKDIALRLNDGRKIDWNNAVQKKYNICYDYNFMGFLQGSTYDTNFGLVCCLSDKFLEVALEEIGEEDLKFYYGVKK